MRREQARDTGRKGAEWRLLFLAAVFFAGYAVIGARMGLMYDASCHLPTFAAAVQVGRVIDELGYLWFEDPYADGGISIHGHQRLKSHVRTPILITEFAKERHEAGETIAHGLAWPERIESGVASLDVIATARLDFEKPDLLRFPCLRLAVEAVRRGGTAMAVLNAANEIAVAAFLDGEVGFIDIPVIIEHVMGEIEIVEPHSLAVVQQADRLARAAAVKFIADALAA